MIPENEPTTFDPVTAVAEFVTDTKGKWWRSMERVRAKWTRMDKVYHNYRADFEDADAEGTAEPRSNIGVPLASQTVDTAVSRIHDNILGRLPYGRVVGREPGDQQKAMVVQQVMDYQMTASKFPIAAHRIIRDCVKYGTGIGKMHFKKKMAVVPEQMKVTLFGVEIPVPGATRPVMREVAEYPWLEHVHLLDCFFPLDAPSSDECQGFIHRTWQTREMLLNARDGLGMPLYSQQAVNDLERVGGQSGKDTDQHLRKQYDIREIREGGLHKDDKLPVLEYCGKIPPNIAELLIKMNPKWDGENPRGDWIVTVVDGGKMPLRAEPSPYIFSRRPYVVARVIDDPGYLAGISLIEFVEKLGLTIDELYNVVMDNLNLIINKMFYVNDLAGIDEGDLVSSPGKIIHGKRPPNEALQVIDFPDLSQAAFVLINMFLGHYKEYTGITNPVLGKSERGSQTATEFSGLMAHSSTRLGQFERALEDNFMRPVFELWTLMNQQFITQDYVYRVFEEGQPIYPRRAPQDLEGVFDYIFEGSTRVESQALRVGQIMQLLQVNATQPVPIYNPVKLGEQLLVEFGWKNIKEFMNPMFADQYLMQQQLQMMRLLGETEQALTPEQQTAAKSGKNPGKQGAAAQPSNISTNLPPDIPSQFRDLMAGMKESVLPQGVNEG